MRSTTLERDGLRGRLCYYVLVRIIILPPRNKVSNTGLQLYCRHSATSVSLSECTLLVNIRGSVAVTTKKLINNLRCELVKCDFGLIHL